jgi:precorrin-6B methylase 2
MRGDSQPTPFPADKMALQESWNARAEAWDRSAPITDAWFRPATESLLRALALRPGSTVLELAAGSGGLTLSLARAVGPSGRVVATDTGPRMIEILERNVRAAGLSNVEARVMDGERPDTAGGPFDAVACRQGAMFFEGPEDAFRRARERLRPGGRIGVTVFTTPDRNELLARPIRVLQQFSDPSGTAPAPPPGSPGPFALGKPGRIEGFLASAGFADVRSEVVPSPMRLPTVDALLSFYRTTMSDLVKDMSPEQREEAWAAVGEATAEFVGPGSPGAPCEIRVAWASRPSA